MNSTTTILYNICAHIRHTNHLITCCIHQQPICKAGKRTRVVSSTDSAAQQPAGECSRRCLYRLWFFLIMETRTFDLVAPFLLTASALLPLVFILLRFRSDKVTKRLSRTHFKIGVPLQKSALQDQYATTHTAQPNQPPRLHSLFIYPVKSCRGIELSRSRVLPTGLESDRLYTFAQLREDGNGDGVWKFLTQRDLPLLASVQVELWMPKDGKTHQGGMLVVRFPWRDGRSKRLAQWLGLTKRERSFVLPIDFPSTKEIKTKGYTFADVKIWTEIATALNMETAVSPELGRYLGCKHRLGLFRMDPSKQREVFRCAPKKEAIGYQPVVDFHDAVSPSPNTINRKRETQADWRSILCTCKT